MRWEEFAPMHLVQKYLKHSGCAPDTSETPVRSLFFPSLLSTLKEGFLEKQTSYHTA